jgi:hypothetical protein
LYENIKKVLKKNSVNMLLKGILNFGINYLKLIANLYFCTRKI